MKSDPVIRARDIYRAALEDMRDHGLRFDLNPAFDWSSEETIAEFWHAYMRRADRAIRDRATLALDSGGLPMTYCGHKFSPWDLAGNPEELPCGQVRP